jgi:putative ABC transport system permease protein
MIRHERFVQPYRLRPHGDGPAGHSTWRSLRREPAFTLLALATLVLGIGANAAIFTVVNAVLLRPLPYSDPDRIAAISSLWTKSGLRGTVSAPDFHDWHDRASSFAAMAYYAGVETSVSVAGTGSKVVRIRVRSACGCRRRRSRS